MKTLTYNLDIGTLILRKRGKQGTFHLFISFTELGDKNRYRASTGTNILKLAEPKAIAMVQQEYKRRKAGIHLHQTITPQRYITNTHIPWLYQQIGLPLDNKPHLLMTERKVKNDQDILLKWFHPFVKGRSWENIQTSAFGRDITAHLRRHIADATICSYLGIFNRLLRQAEIDSYTIKSKLEGVPALSQEGYTNGTTEKGNSYAVATDEMVYELLNYAEDKLLSQTRADLIRTYTQAYALLRILADTGIRPFTVSPLNFNDFDDQGDMIVIDRKEKGKKYYAQGSAITRQALVDLRNLYLSEGTNVNQHEKLPLIHHHPKGNKYNQTEVEPLSQIVRFHLTLNRLMRSTGWYDLKDKEGRIYRSYSIRKWHINKSIQSGEDRFQIADRVGHTYAVLEKFYLNKGAKQKRKADIWDTRKVNTNEKYQN